MLINYSVGSSLHIRCQFVRTLHFRFRRSREQRSFCTHCRVTPISSATSVSVNPNLDKAQTRRQRASAHSSLFDFIKALSPISVCFSTQATA
ncbi:MAG: hypothetical protein IKV15_00820 [Bacteroidaceae bacterium]|nr:hypothetical protein [Bacteroidaceae bacterium]